MDRRCSRRAALRDPDPSSALCDPDAVFSPLDSGHPAVERALATLTSRGRAYLAQLQELPVMVNEGQNLLEVEVLLLALHAQVVESQVNHIDPGQGCAEVGPGEAAAWAARLAAPWLQAEGQGQGWDLGAGGRVAPGETREGRSGGASRGLGRAPPSHHRRGSLSMYSGPWLHTEQKNR